MKAEKIPEDGHTVFVYYAVDYRVPCIYNRSPDSVFDHELF